ncbi:rRNA processing/ribosome biogenesis-domain-containing protein [Chlamydoabsidia padenii]|nr:rRNA processing/ribosome biogenesis-domain-containing protein [Chlamydoabsidia padenii]
MSTLSRSVDMLAQLLSYYLSDDSSLHNNLPFIMDAILTRSLLKDQDNNDEVAVVRRKWTVRLNSLIQSKQATARWSAVVLIKLTCEESPSLLFAHIRSWSAQLLGLVTKTENDMIHKAAIETLSFLFSYTSNKPELQREITVPNLPRFNQALLNLCKSTDLLPVILTALKTNIIHFPSQSRHIADQCLRRCLSCLNGEENINKETLNAACQCLAALHHVNGKTSSSDQWKDNILHLIGSVHVSLNRLFDTIDEELELSDLPPAYPTADTSPDPIVAFPLIVRRVKSLNMAITTCLGSPTFSVVSVPIVQLIDLVCRVYNVFEGSLMREFKDKTEFTCLMSCLPTLHQSANKLVSALLLSSGSHLSRYSKLFSRILIRMLNEYKTQRTLKISVYNIISLCLQQFGYVFGESMCKPLVTSILEDIRITEQKVTDMAPTEVKNKSMKRKRDTLTNSDLLANSGQSTQAPHDIQMAGLDSLQDLLNCFGSSMDLHTRNLIDSSIISRLLLSAQKPLGFTLAGDTNVKEKLYCCLLGSIMNPIEVQATALPHAIRIFTAGLNEQNHQLQAICKQGLAICNLIIHPRMPPIQSTTNTITAKLNQAIQDSEKKSNDDTPTSSYPATTTTITSNALSAERNIIEQPVIDSSTTSQPLVDQTTSETDTVPSRPTKDLDESTTENENIVLTEKETDAVMKESSDDIPSNDPSMITTTTTTNEIQPNNIDYGNNNDDSETVTERRQVDTIITFDNEAGITTTQQVESTTTTVETNTTDGTSSLKSTTIDDDSDYDLDMGLPAIDMTGPDTDDDEED